MKTKVLFKINRLLVLMTLLVASSSFGQFTQTVTNILAPGPNVVEKSATAITLETFQSAVGAAWTNNSGGVLNFPTGVPLGTTVYNGNYGTNGSRLQINSSVNMQNITTSAGSFSVISAPNGTTSQANQSDYTLTLGLFDSNALPVVGEVVKQIGFVFLSRGSAVNNYPLDLRVTVTFSDDSTEVVTSPIGAGSGVDDTFFSFVAPTDLAINSVRLQSFVPNTETPVTDRMGWDDFGFIAGPSSATPQPQIINVNPAAFSIHTAANGIQFETLTYVNVDPTNISLVLNDVDVSGQLIFTGDPTNYSAAYNGLLPDQEYNMTISVTNSAGVATLNRTFYTITAAFPLYDSEGFTDDVLYPLGSLQPVAHGRGTWAPHAGSEIVAPEPAQIVDVGETHGKVLERPSSGASRADFLFLPPVSSGTIVMEFDAFVSTTLGRTIDICFQPTTGGATMASFLAWGEVPGKLAYYNNSSWVEIADLETDWHRVKIINYLSGAAAGTYDVFVNDVPVAQKIFWRNAAVGSAFNQFRIQTQDTAAPFQFGRIDNLVITAAPEDPNAFLPPTISNIAPANGSIVGPQDGISFEVSATLPISTSDVVMRINGVPVELVFGGSPTNRTASYGPLNLTGNLAIEIEASNGAGTTIVPMTLISTDEPWLVHPADGWLSPWVWTSGAPELRTELPLDETGTYVRLDTSGGLRNFMREYQSGAVDINQPHYIRWKFRVNDPDFYSNFTVFNDRAHFFAHPVSRIGGGTTGGNSWSIMATGAGHASGAAAGQTFWIYDNVLGDGAFNMENHVDSQILLQPDHVYSFEVLVLPTEKSYSVVIADVTAGSSFTSSAPHKFRDLTDATHTFLHFGIQTSVGAESRSFDLDSVSVVQSPLAAVTLRDLARTPSSFSFSFISRVGISHLVEYKNDLNSATWTPLETVSGDGTLKVITHNNPPDGTLFYRINSQ